ncbi:GNAT family N-acetyltransferase [Sphingomonas sp. SUN019]|uniref:GNAT family N-acetyltransferase n=1 Tax=Sphingomonas sp. SUN019 TaxID=2937788 RepID=UPI002164BEEC|nr:GNAT family N-acetyltransferase [Sphingomonas sp. SUN019]UVO51883.1 GNAT family N-acetyltransferase [Sphingomonas sp. SUN019]
MQVRYATGEDLPAFHALVERAYRGDAARAGWTHEADLLDGQRTDLEALAETLADPDRRILAAFDGDTLIGCVQISKVGSGRAYLGLLTVDPDRQAGGLGAKLIAAAEDHAVVLFGAQAIEMTVIRQRRELIAYYERRGYALTGEERPFPLDDPRFGVPRTRDLAFVVLLKPLAAPPSPQ